VEISKDLSSYNTDRHTFIYQVGFEPANSGLSAEQFTDNAAVSSVCTFSVSVLGHKVSFHLLNMLISIRVGNL
jgi:hypothetical protein